MSIQKIKQESLDFGLTGAVAFFGLNTAPAGWLKANGALVSRTTYASLFAVIGTTYGAGDSSTTFALPDMRGEFPRGWDDGRSIDSGRVFGSAQSGEIQSHTHTTNAGSDGVGQSPLNRVAMGANNIVTGPTIQATGGTETRPRNVALLACIKF